MRKCGHRKGVVALECSLPTGIVPPNTGKAYQGSTSQQTQQYATFRDEGIFPPFSSLPEEDSISFDFYTTLDGFNFIPEKPLVLPGRSHQRSNLSCD